MNQNNNPSNQTDTTTLTTTTIVDDDWDKPLTIEELEAIDAAFQQATATTTTTEEETETPQPPISTTPPPPLHSLSNKTPRDHDHDDDDTSRPSTRRKLPTSLRPCSTFPTPPRPPVEWKRKYPVLNYSGRIVYAQTAEEVEQATLQLLKFVNMIKERANGRAVLGLDIEWKPSFCPDIPQGKAAVMQICGDMNDCYVLHIIHSGIPQCLKSLLEDFTTIKVGLGIDNDAVKVYHDHNVPIHSCLDLSGLANETLGGIPRQWSLAALVETLICKQLLKPKLIRTGNWEACPLSEPQLKYAATDAFASWYLYEVLQSYPNDAGEQKEK